MQDQVKTGDIVQADYKSGSYIGEVVGFSQRRPGVKVRIMAVVKHPEQGDLHHPGEIEVAMFHQRKALAEKEVALVPLNAVRPHTGEIPDYGESLRRAWEEQFEAMQKTAKWAQVSLEHLVSLKKDYGF